jgi:hypothetical protein
MDHHEAVRKFEHLMLQEADHARELVTELEALVPVLTTENSRQLAQHEIKGEPQTVQRISPVVGEGQKKMILGSPKLRRVPGAPLASFARSGIIGRCSNS